MQKLKYSVLDKMILNKCTSAEVNFICHIAKYQKDDGTVQGVYYKKICEELDCADQTFYDVMKSLEKKKIIKRVKASYYDWDIVILDNDFTEAIKRKFSEEEDRYINLNHDIFYKKEFMGLKAGEKLLAMKFLIICFSGKGSYNLGLKKFYKDYMKLFGVTKRALQNYLKNLKIFFSIGVKDKQYWITPLVSVYKKIGNKRTDDSIYNPHFGEVICRRVKIKFTKKTLKDTVDLLSQYRSIFLDQVETVVHKAILRSIEKANIGIRTSKWIRELQPKLVHKMIQEEINELITE